MEERVIEHVPWRGPECEFGIDGQRFAIVGYSHWLGDNEVDSDDATVDVVSKVISGEYNIAFFNHVRNYFKFVNHQEFWNHVMFFNFLPSCVGKADERFKSGMGGQIERAKTRFLRIIRKHQPHKVRVFTRKGWWMLPATREELPLGTEFPGLSWGTYDADGHIVRAFGLRHPQGANGELMRRAVEHIRALPLRCRLLSGP